MGFVLEKLGAENVGGSQAVDISGFSDFEQYAAVNKPHLLHLQNNKNIGIS